MANFGTYRTPPEQRNCLDPPCRTGRSADSGYGSIETSPTRGQRRRRPDREYLSLTSKLGGLSLNSYDGNSSEEPESGNDTHEGTANEIPTLSEHARGKFATLPLVSRRRISRTDSFQLTSKQKNAHRRNISDNTEVSSSRVRSLRTLDRFVPLRDHVTPGSSKLHTTKPLEELTPSERLVRHNQDAPDPFFFIRRPLPPSPTEARKETTHNRSRTILDPAGISQPGRRMVCHGIVTGQVLFPRSLAKILTTFTHKLSLRYKPLMMI